MAIGLPVVAFDIDGNPESVEDWKTGYLVPLGDVPQLADAVLKLAQDPSLRDSMGRIGRHRVETHFAAADMVDKFAKVIDRQVQLANARSE